MTVSEREIQKELREHPWASRKVAKRIAEDHARHKTTTKEGKRLYQRDYMRDKRNRLKIPSAHAVIGLPRQPNLLSLLTGKRRKK